MTAPARPLAPVDRPRPGWLLRTLTRYEPLAWQSISLGLVCPVILELLLRTGSVFRPDRAGWIHACCVAFLAFAVLAAVSGRVGRVSLWAQCVEALVMVPVVGTSTTHVGVLAACAVTLVLVLVSAAAYLVTAEVAVLTALAGVAFATLLVGQGYGGASLALTVAAVVLLAGVPAGIVLAFRTRAEGAVHRARTASRTDALTGLLNRRGLAEAATDVVAQARAEGVPVAALVVDVDHFKRVNDAHGHATGDRVLQEVAAVVRAACGPGDAVARLGGEELCVLLRCADDDDLARRGERLRAAVEQAATEPSVTVSVGGALVVPPGPHDPGAAGDEELVLRLVDHADVALYEVKRSGRNAVRVQGHGATVDRVPRQRPAGAAAPSWTA